MIHITNCLLHPMGPTTTIFRRNFSNEPITVCVLMFSGNVWFVTFQCTLHSNSLCMTFSFFWQSLTLLAGVVDKRNRTQRNGSALYVTIRMQPTHATQRNRCVRDDENVTKQTQPTQRMQRNLCVRCVLYATNATHATQRNRCVRNDPYATNAT